MIKAYYRFDNGDHPFDGALAQGVECLPRAFARTVWHNHGFDHMKVALSVGVQEMVRSDKAGAGVMFSIDTETGFPDSVLITGRSIGSRTARCS